MGLAAQNFADVNGKLPVAVQIAGNPANGTSNMMSTYRTPGFGPNWAVLMLPYFEQSALLRSKQRRHQQLFAEQWNGPELAARRYRFDQSFPLPIG